MSTVVARSRDKHPKNLLGLSDDARQRIRERLKSAGIHVERLQPLIWPEDAVSAFQEYMYAPWQFTTKADILRKRRERMEEHLRRKREYGITQRRALYVWVFWCPGINDFIFRGWWTYLVGIGGKNYHGDGYKGQVSGRLCNELMNLFPLVEPKPFAPPSLDEWMAEFVKRYQRGCWCGKPQGKSPIWAEVKGGDLVRILDRAEWPEGLHETRYPAL